MATPNFEQIQSFGVVTQKVVQAATDEFMSLYNANMTIEEITDLMALVAENYNVLGYELGAQWYDLCSQLANIDAEPAELPQVEPENVKARSRAAASRFTPETPMQQAIRNFLETEINNSIRQTGHDNLWRDYERGLCKGRWARVPVGDTCAWCLMLASNGAWYLSKESALGANGNHYHDNCNCIAVYHADANNIPNYRNLLRYKSMYYDARNALQANRNGREPYPDELQKRVVDAKARHKALEEKKAQEAAERGEDYKEVPWTSYNETLIVMRYQNKGLK